MSHTFRNAYYSIYLQATRSIIFGMGYANELRRITFFAFKILFQRITFCLFQIGFVVVVHYTFQFQILFAFLKYFKFKNILSSILFEVCSQKWITKPASDSIVWSSLCGSLILFSVSAYWAENIVIVIEIYNSTPLCVVYIYSFILMP